MSITLEKAGKVPVLLVGLILFVGNSVSLSPSMTLVFANGNSPPIAPVVDVTPNNPYTSDNLVCSITTPSNDPDGDDVTYSYAWFKDNVFQPDLTVDTVDSSYTSREEVWKCIVTPNDGSIDGSSAEDQVVINNSGPSVDSVSISPDPAYTNTNLTAIPSGWSDPDGDNEGYQWEWLKWKNSVWKKIPGPGTNTDALDSSKFKKGDQIKVICRPFDGNSNGIPVEGIIIIANSPPTAPVVNVTPDTPLSSDDLVCTITTPSTDPDGDSITYSYAWFKDGVLQGGLTGSTVDLSNTSGEQVWKCVVAPNDGTVDGPSDDDQVTIVIANSPPELWGGVASPTSGGSSTAFTYTVTYADADNDPSASITVSIDGGAPQDMTVKAGENGDYTDGEAYEYTASGLSEGSHTFQFAASDGVDDALGDTGIHDGPTVENSPPHTSGHDPAKDAIDVPISTNIIVHVQDNDDGVDLATISMTVEGSQVTPTITGDSADYKLTYDPAVDFNYLQVVDVTVYASDLVGNPMATDSYSFTTLSEPPASGGNGGFWFPPIVVTPPGVTNVSDSINEDGVFTEKVTAKSEDGQVKLTINESTIGKTKDDEPLSEISITEMKDPPVPPADCTVVCLIYDIEPDGAAFDPPANLTFTYDSDKIDKDEGVSYESLVIAMWDEGAGNWVMLEGCNVAPLTHTITVPISHLTTFTVLAYTRPAVFTVSDLTISPAEVEAGERVTIRVLVTNSGGVEGGYTVILKINGAVVVTRDASVTGGSSQAVTFTDIPTDVTGSYTVTIGELSGKFTVKTTPVLLPAPVFLPAPAPAFITSNLTISSAEVKAGEMVTISVLVANTGDAIGTHTATLKIDDIVMDTKDVTVAAGSNQVITFTTSKDIAGGYTIDVDGLSGKFKVTAIINWWLIGIIVAVSVAVGMFLVIYYLILRRDESGAPSSN